MSNGKEIKNPRKFSGDDWWFLFSVKKDGYTFSFGSQPFSYSLFQSLLAFLLFCM